MVKIQRAQAVNKRDKRKEARDYRQHRRMNVRQKRGGLSRKLIQEHLDLMEGNNERKI